MLVDGHFGCVRSFEICAHDTSVVDSANNTASLIDDSVFRLAQGYCCVCHQAWNCSVPKEDIIFNESEMVTGFYCNLKEETSVFVDAATVLL